MAEAWQLAMWVGAGIIFAASVINSAVQLIIYMKKSKKNADAYLENKINDRIQEHHNDSLLRDASVRDMEMKLFKEYLAAEIRPIAESLAKVEMMTEKLHHSQMTSLQIKLADLFNHKFDKRGILNKPDQTNWDKWFSDYTALGGNSDIKRMDDMIQKARIQSALDKVRVSSSKNKKEETTNED
ncbi:MAG: hypothetical protein ACNA7U_01240 [Candidatus Izemoplasmataceae bacterium]